MEKARKVLRWLRYSKPVRTAAQTAIAVIGTNAVGVTDVEWVGVSSASGLAALLCILLALSDGSTLSGDPEVPAKGVGEEYAGRHVRREGNVNEPPVG
jgi:hypothetical protein